MIDRETQQKIKDAANIVEVVSDYVKLTRRGANYMGLCPFHNEKTPSFSVSPRRNFCHCFSCKKGGSPINFLMEKEGIGYNEALLLLAKKYNIPVQERELSDEERRRMSEREALIVASEWAMNTFHDNLFNTEEGRDIGLAYLFSRGITEEAIRKYKLGYAIDRGDALLSKAIKEGFDIQVFKQIGLVGTSQQGRDYDKFRGRVIFPIRNASGKPIAFGGRALKGEAAKYINSPETTLYHKSNELYGIFEAKAEIVRNDRVFLMEGYLDVIGSWQAGLKNAVASSGTALTENQIALLHRFTSNVTLIYDGDSAGIKASLRGIDMLLSQNMHVKVLLLPDGDDPDSFARKHSPEEFQQYIDSHQTDFINYKIKAMLKNAGGNPQEIAEAVRSIVNSIACIPDEIERISYIKECSRLVDIDDKIITKQVNQAIVNLSNLRRNTDFRQQPPSTEIPQSRPDVDSNKTEERPAGISPFRKHEEEILKYCVKFGFLPVNVDPDRPELLVIEYVDRELGIDKINFSDPLYTKLFSLLKQRKETFAALLESKRQEVEKILANELDEFRSSLASAGGSLAKIKSEEKKFLERQAQRREELINQFATDYSIDFLISHEDDDVRGLTNKLVAERHILSNIFSRDGFRVEPDEEKLHLLVPRALSELRSEILNKKVHDLQISLAKAIEDNDSEAQQRIMEELSMVLRFRSVIAENLGDRILSPRT